MIKKDLLTKIFLAFLIIAFAIAVGHRDISIGTDTYAYASLYDRVSVCHCLPSTTEPGFALLTLLVNITGATNSQYFSLLSMISFGLALKFAYAASAFVADENQKSKFVLLYVSLLLITPFFISAQLNVLRQGIATFIIMLAALCMLDRRPIAFFMYSILATSVHYSSIMYVLLIPLLRLRYTLTLVLTIAAVAAYLTSISESLIKILSGVTGLSIYQYVNDFGMNADYRGGVRYDFALFSLAPPTLFLLLRPLLPRTSAIYIREIIHIYFVLLLPFWFFGWANFADRYAFSAWLVLPVLIASTACTISRRLPYIEMLVLLPSSVFFLSQVI